MVPEAGAGNYNPPAPMDLLPTQALLLPFMSVCLSRREQFQQPHSPFQDHLYFTGPIQADQYVFEIPSRAVNPLIPAQLHQPCWEGKVGRTSVPGPLLSHGHDGHTFSRTPKTMGTTQCTLWPPDRFSWRQPVLPRTSMCICLCMTCPNGRMKSGSELRLKVRLPALSSCPRRAWLYLSPKCFGQTMLLKTGMRWKSWAWGGKYSNSRVREGLTLFSLRCTLAPTIFPKTTQCAVSCNWWVRHTLAQ